MLMSSEKEFTIIPKKRGIKYSIQLTFIECLLWACCWVRLINISWTRLMLGGMKSWLLLFVQSSFPPTSTGWILLPEWFRHSTNSCMCVGALHYAVLCRYSCIGFLLLHLSCSHASAWFLLHPTLFLTSLTSFQLALDTHMDLVSLFKAVHS